MHILMVIDSLELNGGSTMFMEMTKAFKKYYPDYCTQSIVVSKTGKYGRSILVNDDLPKSYDCDIPSISYELFNPNDFIRSNTIFVHHRLQCTQPFEVKCPYIVINHTVQSPKRIKKFQHANKIISVCKHIKKLTKDFVKSDVIINGVENDYIKDLAPATLEGSFKTGRCHRLLKMRTQSLSSLIKLRVKSHKHYIMGPATENQKAQFGLPSNSVIKYCGSVFNRQEKMSFIKALDAYFYDTRLPEGLSMAVLESLSCGVPVVCKGFGGNLEVISHGINGFFFERDFDAMVFLQSLADKPENLRKMKRNILEDFDKRLHVRHMVKKYVDLFKSI